MFKLKLQLNLFDISHRRRLCIWEALLLIVLIHTQVLLICQKDDISHRLQGTFEVLIFFKLNTCICPQHPLFFLYWLINVTTQCSHFPLSFVTYSWAYLLLFEIFVSSCPQPLRKYEPTNSTLRRPACFFVIKASDMKDFSSCDSNLFSLFWLTAPSAVITKERKLFVWAGGGRWGAHTFRETHGQVHTGMHASRPPCEGCDFIYWYPVMRNAIKPPILTFAMRCCDLRLPEHPSPLPVSFQRHLKVWCRRLT